MVSNDSSPDQHDNVISAGRAAASWARARRAAWTDVPLAVHTTARESPPPRTPPAPLPIPAAAAPLPHHPTLPVAIPDSEPAAAERAVALLRTLAAPARQWLPRAAAAAAVIAVVVVGGRYLWNAVANRPAPAAVAVPVAAVAPGRPSAAAAKRKPAGALRVTSSPAGAQVFVDGKAHGVTPLTIADLSVGRHAVELKSDAGNVQRTVTVAADKTAEMDESIFSGWLAVYSPIEVAVTEGGRALLMDDRHQVMLPPGRHLLRLLNRGLAYDSVHQVDLKPGEVTTLTVAPPPSTITVTANEAAEVWLDGARVGETPLNGLSVSLGSHDLVVRRAAGGERRFSATVTVNPFTLHVDFSRPAG